MKREAAPAKAPAAARPAARRAGPLGVAWAIARKDWRVEGRARSVLTSTLFFAGLVVTILAFAFGRDENQLRAAGPGVLWVAIAFASILAAGRAFASEDEDGALESLLLYPAAHELVYIGKLLSTTVMMLVLAAIVAPLTVLLYGLDVAAGWAPLALVVALGTAGFSIVATFFAALTVNLRARESLLPVLVFPLVVPVVLGAVNATAAIVTDGPAGLATGWLQLLVGFDVIYAVACTLAFPFVVEG